MLMGGGFYSSLSSIAAVAGVFGLARAFHSAWRVCETPQDV